jgi:hypothetical protein
MSNNKDITAPTDEQVDTFCLATGLPAGAYGLYQQVLADPSNVGYREILADWMDEYGPQPAGGLYADFTRTQIALSGKVRAGAPWDWDGVLKHERGLFSRGAVLATPGRVLTAEGGRTHVEWWPHHDIDNYPGTVARLVAGNTPVEQGPPVTFRCVLGNVDWVTSTLLWWERMGPAVVSHYPVFLFTPHLGVVPGSPGRVNQPLHIAVLRDGDTDYMTQFSSAERRREIDRLALQQPHYYIINWSRPTVNWGEPQEMTAWAPLPRRGNASPWHGTEWPWVKSRLTNDIPHRHDTLEGLYHALSWLMISWAREVAGMDPLPVPTDFGKDVPEEISQAALALGRLPDYQPQPVVAPVVAPVVPNPNAPNEWDEQPYDAEDYDEDHYV